MNADRLLEVYQQISEAPDAVARLRRFVLDLAVRGKLVEQDSGDEPASVLLDRMIVERSELERSRAIKKVNLTAFNASKDIIPANWVWTQLGTIGDWGSGSTPQRGNSEFYGGGISWLKSGELGDTLGLKGSEETVTEEALAKCSFRLNKPGDVLIAMYGATIGKLAILAEEAVTNQAVCGCTPFAGLSNRYLFLFLLANREAFHASSEGGAQPNISKVKIVNTPFPLPPLAEQHRIVAKVDELMALCNRLEEARKTREELRDKLTAASLARLTAPDTMAENFPTHAAFALEALPALTTRSDQIKTLRQTILNLAVRGKLVEQDPTDGSGDKLLRHILAVPWEKKRKALELEPDEAAMASAFFLPPNWTWATVQALTRLNQTVTYGILKPEWMDEGVPTVRVTEMKTGEIDVSLLPRCRPERAAKFSKTTLESGDLLVSKDGTIGKTAFVPPELAGGNITQHVLRFPICEQVDRRFVRLAIDSPFCQSWMDGETKGVALQGVNVGDFRRMPIPLPPLSEQLRIVAKVDALMALCDRLEASLITTDSTRTCLLEALLHEALEPADRVLEVAE